MADRMLAITALQPYPTAIARRIKTIETKPGPPAGEMCPDGVRPTPGHRVRRGERIAIHAGATWYPGWCRWYYPGDRADAPALDLLEALGADLAEDVNGSEALRLQARWAGLPLMAVVATARVVDALPILGEDNRLDRPWRPHIAPYRPGRRPTVLAIWHGEDHYASTPRWRVTLIPDELPLGDYTPGRWGWLLDDVRPLATPVPVPGRQGVWALPDHIAEEVRRAGG